jgi:hypothetical protein
VVVAIVMEDSEDEELKRRPQSKYLSKCRTYAELCAELYRATLAALAQWGPISPGETRNKDFLTKITGPWSTMLKRMEHS